MAKYKKVRRCKTCGKIYPHGIPCVCEKCGEEIGKPAPILALMLGGGEVIPTDQCETVTAKRTLFGWKIRKAEGDSQNGNDENK